ncbi:MAG TPA: CHAT domain-containing tetratricopeptide repeat protein [Candidatus Angelobacter sp.]
MEKFDDEFSGAKKAGLLEGDVLLTWSRGDASGRLETPFDLDQVVVEELVRGPVTVEGMRGAEKRTWTVVKQYWGAIMRPNFSEVPLAAYREGAKLAEAGKLVQAAEVWRNAADRAQGSQYSWLSPWLLSRAAHKLADGQQWKEADDAYQEAIARAALAGPGVAPLLLFDWAATFCERSDWDQAVKYLQQAIAENQKAGLENLVARGINQLGWISWQQGDLLGAERQYRQALEIEERLEPASIASASIEINLGIVFEERRDLVKGEEYYRKALAIFEKQAPGSNGVAYILNDLGEVARVRGDLDRAEAYMRKGLAIVEHLNPGILNDAIMLNTLSNVLALRGDIPQAEALLQQSLAIKEKVAPGSLEVAQSRESLGDLAQRRGDFPAAEGLYRQALELREKLAPGSLSVAESLHSLGDVSLAAGDSAKAEAYYQRALTIRTTLTDGSVEQAESLAALAGIMRLHQQPDAAERFYAQALQALESQTARLGGGSDTRAGFRAKHEDYYSDYIDLLLSRDKPDLALQALERFRARTLLETLATAHVDVRAGTDPELIEKERSLRAGIKAKTERRISLLADKHTDTQMKSVEKEISDFTSAYQDVEGQIRSSSPGYAALTQPQPLSAAEIQQQLLDQDTLLLEYSLGEERSHVFAVTPDSLQAFDLPKRADIERASRRVYRLLTAPDHSVRGETPVQRKQRQRQNEDSVPKAAAELSRMVLGPVAKQLAGKRLLIVADGALQYIPFAVLAEPEGTGYPEPASAGAKRFVPLIVKHEIVNLPSASVLAVLRQQEQNRSTPPKAVAVLADPVFNKQDPRVAKTVKGPNVNSATVGGTPRSSVADDLLAGPSSAGLLTRSAADVGLGRNGQLDLPRLRFSRQEADSILAVTAGGQGMEAVDFKANRAAAMDPALSQYRIVHLATHGLLDSQHPELSGLVLSLVDEKGRPQDGFLGLEDIYNLNLPADLVVLSSCETALGKEISGEGLVGLTRGFMYAGASRVVASLWKVSDAATARLMADFYKAMEHDGLRPAAALRSAQVRMWKQKRWSSPYFWAAFQIQGEWK